MKNVERNEDIISLQLETADKEGTYEQTKGDLGSKTIYSSAPKANVQKKTKAEEIQKVIFTD